METISIVLILLLFHFVVDFVFQRHETAINKGLNIDVLLKHSFFYSLFMNLGYMFCVFPAHISMLENVMVSFSFGVTHFFIDGGWPIVLWAKFIHQNPLFADVKTLKDGKEAILKDCLAKPFRPTIYIAVDQIFHVLVIVGIGVYLTQ